MPLPTRTRILLVEDDESIRVSIAEYFEAHGYAVDAVDSCSAGTRLFRATRPDAVVCDYRLSDGDGAQLLEAIRRMDALVPFIVVTAHGSIDLAVHMMKEGATHFITKPVNLDVLRALTDRLLDERRVQSRAQAAARAAAGAEFDPFCGTSEIVHGLREMATSIAAADAPVLIWGETGSGKGVLARWMHAHSPRCNEAFVDINGAGLSRELLESELFGHEKGAFTGAVNAKAGLLEMAHKGTVFLDEIGEIHMDIQPKLLKVLEEGRFRRVGDVQDRKVDVRLVVATNRDLATAVRQNQFRGDLFYRINTFTLALAPLRQRSEDIPLLADEILQRLAMKSGRPEMQLTREAFTALRRYDWPGNIRELRNVLERALLLTRGSEITADDLRFHIGAPAPLPDEDLTLADLERLHIRRVLDAEGQNVERAARRLGIPRSTLYRRLKELAHAE